MLSEWLQGLEESTSCTQGSSILYQQLPLSDFRNKLTRLCSKSLITLEAIYGVDDFVDNIEIIKLSPQIVSAIDDPLLQRYISLNLDTNATICTEEWLASSFEEQLSRVIERQPSSRKLSDLLLKFLSYTRFTKVSVSLSIVGSG